MFAYLIMFVFAVLVVPVFTVLAVSIGVAVAVSTGMSAGSAAVASAAVASAASASRSDARGAVFQEALGLGWRGLGISFAGVGLVLWGYGWQVEARSDAELSALVVLIIFGFIASPFVPRLFRPHERAANEAVRAQMRQLSRFAVPLLSVACIVALVMATPPGADLVAWWNPLAKGLAPTATAAVALLALTSGPDTARGWNAAAVLSPIPFVALGAAWLAQGLELSSTWNGGTLAGLAAAAICVVLCWSSTGWRARVPTPKPTR